MLLNIIPKLIIVGREELLVMNGLDGDTALDHIYSFADTPNFNDKIIP